MRRSFHAACDLVQGSIIPLKVTTFGQGHGEFEQPSLGIASIGQVRVEVYSGPMT